MHYVQTRISKEQLAKLHSRAIMEGKSLSNLLNEVITTYLNKEDETCQKLKTKLSNAQENS